MTDKSSQQIEIACDCGWNGSFEKSLSGVQIECTDCGKIHRLPTFSDSNSDVDTATLNTLLGRRNIGSGACTVTFAPIFKLACAVGAVVILIGVLLVPGGLPTKLGIAGIGLGWPLGIGWAWISQCRYLRKVATTL